QRNPAPLRGACAGGRQARAAWRPPDRRQRQADGRRVLRPVQQRGRAGAGCDAGRRRTAYRAADAPSVAALGDQSACLGPARAARTAAGRLGRQRDLSVHAAAHPRKHAVVAKLPATVADTAKLLAEQGYIADQELATTVHLALTMRRPLFLEG